MSGAGAEVYESERLGHEEAEHDEHDDVDEGERRNAGAAGVLFDDREAVGGEERVEVGLVLEEDRGGEFGRGAAGDLEFSEQGAFEGIGGEDFDLGDFARFEFFDELREGEFLRLGEWLEVKTGGHGEEEDEDSEGGDPVSLFWESKSHVRKRRFLFLRMWMETEAGSGQTQVAVSVFLMGGSGKRLGGSVVAGAASLDLAGRRAVFWRQMKIALLNLMNGNRFLFLTLICLGFAFSSVSAEEQPELSGLEMHVVAGSDDGPTVLVTFGLDRTSDYAPEFLEEFSRRWPVRKGKVVFAIVNDAARATGEAGVTVSRGFPVKEKRSEPAGATAAMIWGLAKEADYVLDFREAGNSRRVDPKAFGQTIVVVRNTEAVDAADAMIHAMNYAIEDPELHWSRLRGGPRGMLARSSFEHFGAEAMTVYFSRDKIDAAERGRMARHGLYRLLDRLRMIDPEAEIFAELNPKPRVPNYRGMYPGRRIVGVYTGNGTGEKGVSASLAAFEGLEGIATVQFTAEEVRDGILTELDLVVFPGGSGGGQARALGVEGREKVTRFVDDGGGYMGICAGAYLALSGMDWGLDLINARTKSPKWRRGQKLLPVELSGAGREFYSGDPLVKIRYNQGPIFEPDDHPDLPPYEVLAYYRDEVAKNGTPAGIQVDSPAIAAAARGAGRVVIIGPHPETTPGAELDYFLSEAGKWLLGEDE